ncbi:unnamed protein product [Mytilus edulis]|uniref:C-type lectin domain-containing protein n=1 Tax=Mytilus edulis TaxID=6550 RepID=A0A8S3S3F4_MYTED|nr:unnamed protein product [Mytilus edulis]
MIVDIWHPFSDLRTAIIQNGDGEPNEHHCLSNTNGRFTTNDCTSKKMFYCDGGKIPWIRYMDYCYLQLCSKWVTFEKESDDSDYWLSYFKYEDEKANAQCVAILRTNNSRSLTYEKRSCKECLPVLCVDQSYQDHISTPVLRNQGSEFVASSTESNFERTTWSTLTNMANVERPVTWEDAQTICSIPSVNDIIYMKREDTKLPKTFTAWTSSRNRTSDWTSFYGNSTYCDVIFQY